jgi:hypothetical protein
LKKSKKYKSRRAKASLFLASRRAKKEAGGAPLEIIKIINFRQARKKSD